MTRTRFHQSLQELKERLLAMGGLAEQAIERSARAFSQNDRELCNLVLRSETAINQAERQIDELALDLLAMQQPMAVDLRFIVSCIKINADLERVGDQAVNIAQRVLDMEALQPSGILADVPRMAGLAIAMVNDALQALVSGDAALAQTVLERDDHVDRMNRAILDAALGSMRESPATIQHALDVMLVARNLERVADHATNIAEDVIFWVRGADVRHHAAE
jgi:phosphate transport system protein